VHRAYPAALLAQGNQTPNDAAMNSGSGKMKYLFDSQKTEYATVRLAGLSGGVSHLVKAVTMNTKDSPLVATSVAAAMCTHHSNAELQKAAFSTIAACYSNAGGATVEASGCFKAVAAAIRRISAMPSFRKQPSLPLLPAFPTPAERLWRLPAASRLLLQL
jgi:hypothetical protein